MQTQLLWGSAAGSRRVVGTASEGVAPMGCSLITAGTENRVFFQNGTTTQVAYWSLGKLGGIGKTLTFGTLGASWQIYRSSQFDTGSCTVVLQQQRQYFGFWEIEEISMVTGTGTLGKAPAGSSILGVGKL